MLGLIDILYPGESLQAITARRFAEKCLDRATVEGYRIVSMDLWSQLAYQERREGIRAFMDGLIEYAQYRLRDTETCSVDAQTKANEFLAMCRAYGACLLSLPAEDFGLDLSRFKGRTACAAQSMN